MRRASGREEHAVVISQTTRIVAGCTGKRCYRSKGNAARLAKQQRRGRDSRVSEYHCNHCHSWHIGER